MRSFGSRELTKRAQLESQDLNVGSKNAGRISDRRVENRRESLAVENRHCQAREGLLLTEQRDLALNCEREALVESVQ